MTERYYKELGSILNIPSARIKKCIAKVKDKEHTHAELILIIIEIAREKIPILPLDIIRYEIITQLDFYDILHIGLTCKQYYNDWRRWITILPKCISDKIDGATLSTFSSITSYIVSFVTQNT